MPMAFGMGSKKKAGGKFDQLLFVSIALLTVLLPFPGILGTMIMSWFIGSEPRLSFLDLSSEDRICALDSLSDSLHLPI